MKIKFTKMQGIGNDYVYVNGFTHSIPNKKEFAIKVSDRHFGIGSDGVIVIEPSDVADAKMDMYNLDGSIGKMCGNGIRCVAKYVYDYGIVDKDKTKVTIETLSGIKTIDLFIENGKVKSAKVDMGKAETNCSKIPMNFDSDTCINKTLYVGGIEYKVTAISMGNPHCVTFVPDVNSIELEKIGPKFEKHQVFPEGANTEFVKVNNAKELTMRVWERGSGETFACGTGACAVVAAATLNGYCREGEDIKVHLFGGDLIINYTKETVLMTGPCETVFEGEIEI